MYNYSIGYQGYESTGEHELTHEKQFTQEEWDQLLIEAYREGTKILLQTNDFQIDFIDILNAAAEWLTNYQGFAPMKYEHTQTEKEYGLAIDGYKENEIELIKEEYKTHPFIGPILDEILEFNSKKQKEYQEKYKDVP